jgi:hypothetical protein
MNETDTVKVLQVKYKYIPKKKFNITNPKHVLYDGKLDSSIDRFPVLRKEDGKYVLNMTEEEKEFIISGLNLKDTDLNLNDRKNEYLTNISIEMPKGGLTLNIAEPYDLLVDKLLQAYDNFIAPSLKAKNNKASYRYVRVFKEDEIDSILETADVKKEFYKALGSLESSREKMVMYLLNEGKKVHPKIGDKTLRNEVNTRAELSQTKFLKAVKDPMFVEKGMLNMAVLLSIVDLRSNLYFFEGQALAPDGEPATLKNASLFIKSKKNGSLRVAISKATLDAFNGVK